MVICFCFHRRYQCNCEDKILFYFFVFNGTGIWLPDLLYSPSIVLSYTPSLRGSIFWTNDNGWCLNSTLLKINYIKLNPKCVTYLNTKARTINYNNKKLKEGDTELTQQLRALAENLSSIPNTHVASHNQPSCNSYSRGSYALFWPLLVLHACTYKQKTQME